MELLTLIAEERAVFIGIIRVHRAHPNVAQAALLVLYKLAVGVGTFIVTPLSVLLNVAVCSDHAVSEWMRATLMDDGIVELLLELVMTHFGDEAVRREAVRLAEYLTWQGTPVSGSMVPERARDLITVWIETLRAHASVASAVRGLCYFLARWMDTSSTSGLGLCFPVLPARFSASLVL